MPFLIYCLVGILVILNLIALLNIIFGPNLKGKSVVTENPFISILIPARNEEQNISSCIEGLIQQDYAYLEILVLDDQSSDKTSNIIEKYSERDSRVRLIKGASLPPNWTGKNWACHQLSQQAAGDILIFTDADNTHSPNAVSSTIAWMKQYNLGMLSAFPQQMTHTFFERLIIPIVDLIVYAVLPLWLTYYSRFASLAAANGQWLAFTRQAYFRIGGHKAVQNEIVEDIKLSRLIKLKSIKMLTLAGTGVIFGRMYRSFSEIWNGLSRSLFGLVSYNDVLYLFIIIMSLLIFVLPYILLAFLTISSGLIVIIALNLMLRTILSINFKHAKIESIIFHPLGILFMISMAINSYIKLKGSGIYWKNRRVKLV